MSDAYPGRRRYPLASNQREIWFDQMLDPDLPSYNVGGYIELPFAVDLPRLRRAYEILTQRHDALRIRLHTNERGLPEQSFEGSVDFEMPLHDLSGSADPRHSAFS